ncbi:MAG: methylated-DNA--[protein]-cysteine S-methyltransferase [Verrucomicrobia bacterium]|nr:methylated-DNA--[protein]-cysteine S-methyltransferase [Verrucomicrobiota bacterium]
MTQAALDYQRVEKAIAFLTAHAAEQPELSQVARAAHLSEYHFQRVFTRWAGISPKRFLQFLTVEHAKQQLLDARAVLDVTLDSGLSSPGRLHDLFVSAEAVTPGEFKTRGAGIKISYGFQPSRFGPCLLGVTSRGVCWLSFLNHNDRRGALRELRSHWSGASISERPRITGPVAARIFHGINGQATRPLGLLLMGTNFQIKVWQALLRIPAGMVTTYQAVAETIGAQRTARAIGGAVGQNAIAYLIPCHRVIRQSGVLGGYRWGTNRKHAMLGWEAARVAA